MRTEVTKSVFTGPQPTVWRLPSGHSYPPVTVPAPSLR